MLKIKNCKSLVFNFSISLLGLLLFLQNAVAKGEMINREPQIQTIKYRVDQITTLHGTHFVATSLQFSRNEKILGIYIGDQIAWTYAINPSAPYILFIKPTLDTSDTNMTVVTNQHIYHFHLLANRNRIDNSPLFNLKFDYKTDEKSNKAKTSHHKSNINFLYDNKYALNTNYLLNGSVSLFPEQIYDDGTFTYFKFSDNAEVPIIFKWEEGHEKLINTTVQGNFVIAKCTAQVFKLQKNNIEAWVEKKINKDVGNE